MYTYIYAHARNAFMYADILDASAYIHVCTFVHKDARNNVHAFVYLLFFEGARAYIKTYVYQEIRYIHKNKKIN